jgi:hypothetical protein
MSESNGARVLWSGSIASDPEINQLLHPSRFYARRPTWPAISYSRWKSAAPFSRPGHRTPARSIPIQLCGDRLTQMDPSRSTRSWMLFFSWTA